MNKIYNCFKLSGVFLLLLLFTVMRSPASVKADTAEKIALNKTYSV